MSGLVEDLSQRTTFRMPADIKQRIVAALRKLLLDPRDPVRLSAYRVLGASHDSVAIDLLVEGLAPGAGLHPIQEAFIEHNAIQCGYCAGGVMIAAAALLAREPSPTREQVQAALDRNICRCGAHNRMIRATQHAAAAAHESAP